MAKQHVVILGLSANPPHVGHKSLTMFLADMEIFDGVLVLPVFKHMFAEKRIEQVEHSRSPSFDDKLEMCRLGLATPKVTVSDVERSIFNQKVLDQKSLSNSVDVDTSKIRVNTADVLNYLKSTQPDTTFHFTMGGDVYQDLCSGKWSRTSEIRELLCDDSVSNSDSNKSQSKLHVVERVGDDSTSGEVLKKLVDSENAKGSKFGLRANLYSVSNLTSVSSSKIRATTDYSALLTLVSPPVAEYIKEKGFYGLSSS
ncbi:hypothetical protein ScalyP_jg4337 [Parmales sp. scaly parma]|nr:hypothetical protein ScalyP_jg4337 [Parmales sp. scaly parma]